MWLKRSLGMSSVASGLFAGLEAQGLPSLFSLLLTPEADGGAELTLGGIDTSKFTGNGAFLKIKQFTHRE